MKFETNVSLKDLNWWKVGGLAANFCRPESVDDLRQALQFAFSNHLAVRVLSGGSNSLIADGTISGLTIHLGSLRGVSDLEEGDRVSFTTMAGTPKSEVAKIFLQRKLAPAVFLTGLPGDVGGGVVMNAGVGEQRTPREFCEIVDWIEVMSADASENCKVQRIAGKDLQWSYRSCSGWQPGVITRVRFSWPSEPSLNVIMEVREANKKRVSTQPLSQPSCGSVFRNPPGLKSAKLIQECGLKGLQLGGAQVSEKHANFIVNTGTATAMDIYQLIQKVQETVRQQTGVELHREVVLFGDWDLNQ